MLDQSAPRMLAWTTRWKTGIYQSTCRAKLLSKQKTVPIWKIWDLDRIDEPKKKVDKRRITQLKQKKYKETRITARLSVIECKKSTSKVPDYNKANTYLQANFDDLETIVMEKNDALYSDAFNN